MRQKVQKMCAEVSVGYKMFAQFRISKKNLYFYIGDMSAEVL